MLARMPSVQPDQVAMAKLDVFLFQMLGQLDRAQARAKARKPGAVRSAGASEDAAPDAADDCVPPRASVYIWFTGDPEDLRRLGFEGVIVEKPTRKSASGTVPIERLREIAAIDHVVEINGPRPVVPQLDHSTAEIGIRRFAPVIPSTPAGRGDRRDRQRLCEDSCAPVS